jgi:glycosyltransferase involved in cell wall biosynthesis
MEGSARGSDGLRVVHFAPYFPPQRIGGVGEFVALLHAGLLRRGHDSRVVSSGSGGSERVARIARTRLGWFLGCFRQAGRAARCDIVHCQSGESLPVLLGLALRPRRRARSLVTFHVASRGLRAADAPYTLEGRRFGPGLAARLRGAAKASLLGLLDALALRLADGAVAVCHSTAEELGRGSGSPLPVVYNGIGPPREDAPGAALAPVELLYVGVPSQRKRVLALPFVLRAVRRALPGARLRIAGFGRAEAPELARLCAELGVAEAVEYLGPRPAAELGPVYRAARLLLLPSAYEGLPTVILEAMREGTPVVATRVSGHPEAIEDGVDGLLAPVDDPPALAARCLELLRDPARAAAVADRARETVARRFDAERCVDEYLDYYRALARGET